MRITEPITNINIEEYIAENNAEYFQGVFSADNINNNIKFLDRFIIVCNLSKEDERGSHFVTLIFSDGYLVYLDSLGLNMTKYNFIERFIYELKVKSISYLNTPIQSRFSNGCGYYCIFFIVYFNHVLLTGNGLDVEKFSRTHLTRNDEICIRNIEK
jgi:hypothetical protein